MPRKARVVIPEVAHHVVQRGNYRQIVFESDKDFRKYAYWTKKYAQECNVKIHAYCLMNNHVHFIVTPMDRNGLARMFGSVHTLYSQYKNSTTQRQGHLWQARFYSCVLSPSHLVRAIRYVEMNPVRAYVVGYPWLYRWSSTRQHMDMERAPIILTETCQQFKKIKEWKAYLLEKDDKMLAVIRSKTKKGLAIGSIAFIKKLEYQTGVCLREGKVGRRSQNRENRGQSPIKKISDCP